MPGFPLPLVAAWSAWFQGAGSFFQARVLAACMHVCLCTRAPGALNVCACLRVQGTMLFLGFRHHADSVRELADRWETSWQTTNAIWQTTNAILASFTLGWPILWCAFSLTLPAANPASRDSGAL